MGVNQYTTATGGTKIEDVVFTDGVADFNGKADCIKLDSDGDTTISAPTDDQIDIEIAGADDFTITANSLNVLSGSTIAGPSSTFYWCAPIAAQQDLSGAGAANLTTAYTAWTTTSTDALTLADGVVKGQYKKIQLVVDGGDGTLTPTNLSGGTNITFADIGDTAELVFDGTNWVAVALYNCADGTSAPVLA
jgi:hypothetical protein